MKVVTWMLISWARDWDLRNEPMDVACWIPALPGLPTRCLCGYGWPPGTPADATKVECEGPFRHVWRDALEEIGERVRAREDAAREAYARGIGRPRDAGQCRADNDDGSPCRRSAGASGYCERHPIPETGETGRSASTPAPATSTGPIAENDVERPPSNNSGRSEVEGGSVINEAGFTLAIRDVPACTACGRIGHLAADCPNN